MPNKKTNFSSKKKSSFSQIITNWKMLVPIVVLIGVIGGTFWVWQSSAAWNYTFARKAGQIAGGTVVKKSDGVSYVQNTSASGSLYTWVTGSEMRYTESICVNLKVLKSTNLALVVKIGSSSGRGTLGRVYKGNTYHRCVDLSSSTSRDSTIIIEASDKDAILIESILGRSI